MIAIFQSDHYTFHAVAYKEIGSNCFIVDEIGLNTILIKSWT